MTSSSSRHGVRRRTVALYSLLFFVSCSIAPTTAIRSLLEDLLSSGTANATQPIPNCTIVPSGWEGIPQSSDYKVSLQPRGNASRPVGFPAWGTRTLILNRIGNEGLSDRMFHFYFVLMLGRLLSANISLPRPCECLSAGHAHELPCSVGWDRYFVSSIPFNGSASGDYTVPTPSNPATPCGAETSMWDLLEQTKELPTSFCVTMPDRIFGREPAMFHFMKRLASEVWGCASPHAVNDLAFPAPMRWTSRLEDSVRRLLKRITGEDDPFKARYGAIHIRRDDRRNYFRCTNVEDAVNMTAEAVTLARAAGFDADKVPWLLFVKAEHEFADELRGNLTQRGIVSHVVLEKEMRELAEDAFIRYADVGLHAPPAAPGGVGGSGPGGGAAAGLPASDGWFDNYYFMRGIHWLVSHAAVSIRSSISNDWMWDHGEQLPREISGHYRKTTVDKWNRTRWVYYLCHEGENCADLINMYRDC